MLGKPLALEKPQKTSHGAFVVHLADEIAQHGFGDFEVCDDTVFQRTNGHDVSGRAP